MSIESAFDALCDMLRNDTGLEVNLGRPDEAKSGLCVWPWRLEDSSEIRASERPSHPAEVSDVSPLPAVAVDFLIIPLVNGGDGLNHIDKVRMALHRNPVLTSDGEVHSVLSTRPIAGEEMANIFSAADIPLTLCVSAILRIQTQQSVTE